MLRFLMPALMMVSALLVLLAGALGDLEALPDLFRTLTAGMIPIASHRGTPSPANSASIAPVAPPITSVKQQATEVRAAPFASAEQQPAAGDQAAQIAQRPETPASPRRDDDQLHQNIDPSQQQDQAQAVVARLRAQEQRAAATASPISPRPQPQRQAWPEAPPASTQSMQANGTTQTPPQPLPAATLMIARNLLASGRAAEARDWLARAQTQMVLQPVTPDQPVAPGGNVPATRVGDAIRFLDRGDTGRAMQAIDMAMASPATGTFSSVQGSVGYSSAPQSPSATVPSTVYPPQPTYYYGYGQR